MERGQKEGLIRGREDRENSLTTMLPTAFPKDTGTLKTSWEHKIYAEGQLLFGPG